MKYNARFKIILQANNLHFPRAGAEVIAYIRYIRRSLRIALQ